MVSLIRSIPALLRNAVWIALTGIAVNYFYDVGKDSTWSRRFGFLLICVLVAGVAFVIDHFLERYLAARHRTALLDAHEAELTARTVARLQLLGVDDNTARAVSAHLLGKKPPEWAWTSTEERILMLTGPVGAGKTTMAEAILREVV